jgi:hypothetical protein
MTKELEHVLAKFGLEKKPGYSTGRKPFEVPLLRSELAELFAELGYKRGAEVGVHQGKHSEGLCSRNPGLEQLYCVDPWLSYGVFKAWEGMDQPSLELRYEGACKRLEKYPCTIIRKTSMEAVGDFVDGSLDFVYIDGAHDLLNVVQDICEWSRKVRIGGIVAGHDFRRTKHQRESHVVYAVRAYVASYHIDPWFVLLGDHYNSFMWTVELPEPEDNY